MSLAFQLGRHGQLWQRRGEGERGGGEREGEGEEDRGEGEKGGGEGEGDREGEEGETGREGRESVGEHIYASVQFKKYPSESVSPLCVQKILPVNSVAL